MTALLRIPSLALLAALSFASAIPAHAESITGTVTNKTVNKPAAGDDVVLIRLAQGMQESTRTKTDARGHYSLDLPEDGLHLVRVTHDKANYFRPAPPGTKSIDIDVFAAAPTVQGVATEADVMRLQTDEPGKSLHIVEHFFVKNDSDPPKTQFSDHPFEFYLPPGAVIEGSAALAPSGMPVQASPVPLGDPNHYTFIFPLRPGETQFQITYYLPYTGSLQISPRVPSPTDTVAIMMPKSMTFKPGPSAPYSPVNDEVDAQTYVARGVVPSQPLSFTLSGSGQLPRETAQAATTGGAATAGAQNPNQGQTATAATDTRPGGGLGNPIDPEGTNDPWAKYKWWILGGLGLVLAAAAGIMLKRTPEPPRSTSATSLPAGHAPPQQGASLAALKDELFSLETDRLQGLVTEGEYREHKAALETVLRRVLARSGGAVIDPAPPTRSSVQV